MIANSTGEVGDGFSLPVRWHTTVEFVMQGASPMKLKKRIEILHGVGKDFDIKDSKLDGQGESSGEVEVWGRIRFKRQSLGVSKYLTIRLISCVVLVVSVFFVGFLGGNDVPGLTRRIIVAILDTLAKHLAG